ncbi:MAG: penicillin acylase family protein, partial [Rhodospirillales bacterium]|nr:penicillin acylase family protein [Acetobacter sp.]
MRRTARGLDLTARLAALPQEHLPLTQPVEIRWNDHQVPFVTAATDGDLAVGLGIVHVHLRWTQLELMRHAVYGRMAEVMGPLGVGIDRMLRTLDLPRAVPQIRDALPAETRHWIASFVTGMNVAIERLPRLPPEFRLLGLRRQPWTLEDVLALTRLAAFDVTWVIWMALLPQLKSEATTALWRRLMGTDEDVGVPILEANALSAHKHSFLFRFARAGSNSWCMAPRGGATGAWIANDTHLSPMLPNFWMIAGMKSPSYHATGLMVPGIPAFLIGRNPDISWGGTNLHAASSDLFDLSDVPAASFQHRVESIKIRGFPSRKIIIRESAYGPVISDLRRLRSANRPFALRWMGHKASDEISGLLAMNRATNWSSFRSALRHIGVPGQNITYADRTGHIGQTMAAHLPCRPANAEGLILPPAAEQYWDSHVDSQDLPTRFDPPEGFVASANNRPVASDVLIGYFFSPDTR